MARGTLLGGVLAVRVLAAQVVRADLVKGDVHLLDARVHRLGAHADQAALRQALVKALHDVVGKVTALDGGELHIQPARDHAAVHEPAIRAGEVVLHLGGGKRAGEGPPVDAALGQQHVRTQSPR